MAEKSNPADQFGESTLAASTFATDKAATSESKQPTKKNTATFTLHPLQDKAIRYLSFMLADTSKPQTATQIVQEAIARYLTTMQKQGNEYPPKMLAELQRLGLIK